MPAAHFLGLRPRLVFAQYPDDLLLAEATPFHRPSPFSGDGLYLISAEFSGCRPTQAQLPRFDQAVVERSMRATRASFLKARSATGGITSSTTSLKRTRKSSSSGESGRTLNRVECDRRVLSQVAV